MDVPLAAQAFLSDRAVVINDGSIQEALCLQGVPVLVTIDVHIDAVQAFGTSGPRILEHRPDLG